MSEEVQQEELAPVQVRITSKAVHNAVRNIISNELKLNPEEIKAELRKYAFETIQKEVIEYIAKSGYGTADLKYWAQRAIEARKKEVDTILKEVVAELVHRHLQQEVIQVVGAVIQNGLTVNVGWNRKIKLQIEPEKEGS